MRGYISGVLTHTTAWDRFCGGDVILRSYIRTRLRLAQNCSMSLNANFSISMNFFRGWNGTDRLLSQNIILGSQQLFNLYFSIFSVIFCEWLVCDLVCTKISAFVCQHWSDAVQYRPANPAYLTIKTLCHPLTQEDLVNKLCCWTFKDVKGFLPWWVDVFCLTWY